MGIKMKKAFFVLSLLLSAGSAFAAKDKCSAELKGMPFADVWDATHTEFRKKFNDKDSVLLLLGKMDAQGNFFILKFTVGAHSEPVDAGFYASSVTDSGRFEFKRGSIAHAESLFTELKAMKLNGMKTREVLDNPGCAPIAPDVALYFVESRVGKGNRFGFYGYPFKDKRYVRIQAILDSFRTSKN